MSSPRLTIAIPLHRAERWVENVAGVIELAPEWSEVVVSDATGEDEALEQLRERFAGDGRASFRPRPERLDWREHCNLLLDESDAEFFCWMPQDDFVEPDDYFSRLVAALEADEEAVLAFAPVGWLVTRGRGNPLNSGGYLAIPRKEISPGETVLRDFYPARDLGMGRPEDDALWLLEHWMAGLIWRGVFRREVARPIPPFGPADHADLVWCFSMGLAGNLRLVPGLRYFKRFHARSAHRAFGPWNASRHSDQFRAEVEARLGTEPARRDRVLESLTAFYRRQARERRTQRLRDLRAWLVDQPRIAVDEISDDS